MTDLAIPPFLRRKPGDVRTVFTVKPPFVAKGDPVQTHRDGGIHPSLGPIAEANIMRLRKLSAKERARGTVLLAIKGGADTFGKIRKETGIEDDSLIRSALRRYINSGRVEQDGRRYHTF